MLSEKTRRRAADLLNLLDLLVRRKLPALGEPWDLNLKQLWLWRERLIDLAETLEKADAVAVELMIDPFLLCGDVPPRAPEPDDSAPQELARTPFNESLIDYALTEYVAEEAYALALEATERAELDLQGQKDRLHELIVAYQLAGLEAPASLRAELAALAESEAEEASEDGADEDAEDDTEGLSLEERQTIFRECHAAAIATIRRGIDQLGQWVRESAPQFRGD